MASLSRERILIQKGYKPFMTDHNSKKEYQAKCTHCGTPQIFKRIPVFPAQYDYRTGERKMFNDIQCPTWKCWWSEGWDTGW